VSPYDALKALGHSPAKAAEIVLNAQRGDWFSKLWIEQAVRSPPPSQDDLADLAHFERSQQP
jgi:hypothetical protein